LLVPLLLSLAGWASLSLSSGRTGKARAAAAKQRALNLEESQAATHANSLLWTA